MTKFLFGDSQGRSYKFGNTYITIPDASLWVDPSTWGYPLGGGSKSFSISSTLYNIWEISDKPSWLTWGYTSSGIDTSCNANDTEASRYGYIDIKTPRSNGTNISQRIPIGQEYVTPSMAISPTSWTYNGNGESKQFSVTSNVNWDVSTNPAWISIFSKTGQTGNGSFYGYASDNTGGSYRSGYITLKCTTYPDLYPAGKQAFVEQPAGRSLYLEYNSSQVYYTEWDSYNGYNCYPNQYAYILYMDLVCTAGEQWYCQFEPNDGTFYKYPASGTGSYSNFQVYFNMYQEYSGSLVFYWTNDDSYAYEIYFEAYDFWC